MYLSSDDKKNVCRNEGVRWLCACQCSAATPNVWSLSARYLVPPRLLSTHNITISQYHWWYIDLMIYQRLYNTYEYSTQYHNLYNDISYGHHIMVYTTISALLPSSWTISHFPENLNVLPQTTKEGLRYIAHIVHISHLLRYLIHSVQWKL